MKKPRTNKYFFIVLILSFLRSKAYVQECFAQGQGRVFISGGFRPQWVSEDKKTGLRDLYRTRNPADHHGALLRLCVTSEEPDSERDNESKSDNAENDGQNVCHGSSHIASDRLKTAFECSLNTRSGCSAFCHKRAEKSHILPLSASTYALLNILCKRRNTSLKAYPRNQEKKPRAKEKPITI